MDAAIQMAFGEGLELRSWQMALPAVAIFVNALVLVRVSGRRSFGQHGPFDACTTVLLGAILSRALVGASPFWPTVAGAAALALMHRLIGQACVRFGWFETLISGSERILFRDGQSDMEQMRRALVTQHDLEEAARNKVGNDDLSTIERITLERNGDITVVKRNKAGDFPS
jgi:uncharacterized membrane protein YcaP (DUF421 family)